MAKQRFQLQFDFEGNMGPIKSSVAELQKSLAGITLPPNLSANFEKLFGKLETEMSEFQAMTKNGFANMADVGKAQTAFSRISKLMNQIGLEANKVKGLDPNKLIPKEAQTRVEGVTKKLKELQAQQSKKDSYVEAIKKQTEAIEKQKNAVEGLKASRRALSKENTTLGAAKGAQVTKQESAEKQKTSVLKRMEELEGTKGGKSSAEYKNLGQELTQLNGIIRDCDKEIARLTTQITKNKASMANLDGEVESSETTLTSLRDKLTEMQKVQVSPEGLLELRKELAELLNVNIDEVSTDLKEIEIAIDSINSEEIKKVSKNMQDLGNKTNKTDDALDKAAQGMRDFDRSAQNLDRASQDMENLKNQVLQFFSLTNSVQLFKRAVMSALDTVKELDATMTEAAVVTEFDVGDMWDKLPEYSANAQKLGVSINGMYQATTLYYQQGLKNNEAMALGIETMKMAKIAGMESAEATEAMTAALRGFNMELNETSATRVNDVYSQLAAVTAADTEQIATAMSKTASIAASANMEFETTAALLAQIIETTQEAPETAGTAMKTIIARFAEVKNLRDQGKSTGTDSEGEGIDVNKIQTALRTVGISMDGFFAGTEGLDSILLKLSEKWDTLDFETQRYIATMAAGSRQQSRFIAMMSDYGRTTELVSEAQNSAGASQKQYEKTLDSMDSKLQKLENAWKEFLMGLTNNEVLKTGVDALTSIVETLNKATEVLSGGNGLIKAVTSLGIALSALKIGKGLLGDQMNSGILGRVAGAITGKQSGEEGVLKKSLGEKLQGTRFGVPDSINPNASFEYASSQIKEQKQKRRDEKNEKQSGRKGIKEKAKGAWADTKEKYSKQITKVEVNDKTIVSNLGKMEQGLDEFDLSAKASGIRLLNEQLADGSITASEAKDKYLELGGSINDLEGPVTKTTADFDAISSTLGNAGAAMMGVGAGLGLLAGLFESLGLEEAAEATQTVAGVFMGLGTVLSVVSSILPIVTSLTAAQAAATWAALWPILLIIAAAAILVVGIIAIAKAWKNASDEAQLEKMNEQVEALGEAADEAKQKLEDMAAAREELEKMGDTLNNLTKGSKEWKEALVENNLKVLELLDTYPELARYISKGLNGELTIKSEGWNEIIERQQTGYNAAIGAKTALTQKRSEKELEIKTENTMAEVLGKQQAKLMFGEDPTSQQEQQAIDAQSKRMDNAEFFETAGGKWAGAASGATLGAVIGTAILPGIGSAVGAAIGGVAGAFARESVEDVEKSQTGGLTYDELNAFGAVAAERGLSMAGGTSKEDFKELYLEMGYNESDFENVWSKMETMGEAFDELANSAMAVKSAEQARVEAIASNVAQTSDIVQSSKYGGVAEEINAQAFENYDDKVSTKAAEYTEDLDDKNLDSKEAEEALQEYADMNGMTLEEVKKKVENEELSKETIANALAAKDVDEEMKKAMENTVKVMEKIAAGKTKDQVSTIKGLMTDRGMGLTAKQAQELNGKDMKTYLAEQGFTEQDAIDMGYESLDAFANAMQENINTANASLENMFSADKTYGEGNGIQNVLNAFNEKMLQLGSSTGLTLEQMQGLAQGMTGVVENGGDYNAVVSNLASVLGSVPADKVDQVTSIFSTVDWTNQDSIDSAIQAIESLGIAIEDDMVKKLYEAANTVKSLDLGKMEEKLKKISETIDNMEDKVASGSQTFSKEERDALVQYGADQNSFVRTNLDEYVYLGDTNQLLGDIKDLTSSILAEMKTDIDEAVKKGAVIEDQKDQTAEVNGKTLTYQQITEQLISGELKAEDVGEDILTQIITAFNLGEGVTLGSYDAAGLGAILGTGYQNYYGISGATYEQNQATQDQYQREYITMGHVQNFQNGIDPGRGEGNYTETVEYYGRDISTGVWLEGAMGATEFTNTDWRVMQSLGYTGEQDMGAAQEWLKQYYEGVYLYEQALDAAIASEQGLNGVLEEATEHLKEQGIDVEKNSNAIKKLIVNYNSANKAMNKLNKVLEDQGDAFASGETGSEAYQAALKQITNAAKDAFGEEITEDFVEQHRELFIQLAEGGEVGEQAYAQITSAYGEMVLETLNLTTDAANQAAGLMNEAFANAEIGEAIDVTELYAKLMAIPGMSDAAAKATLAAWQFSIEPTEDYVWIKGGIVVTEDPNDPTWQKVPMLMGTKQNPTGTGPSSPPGGGGGGSSSKWENPYDEFYNSLQKLNAELRKRNKLEREYNRLLEISGVSGEQLAEVTRKQMASLQAEKEMREWLLGQRERQMTDIEAEYSDVGQYAWYDEETGSVQIDWAALERLEGSTDEDFTSRIEEYISKLEEQIGLMEEQEDAIWDIEDQIKENQKETKSQYLDFRQQVYDALTQSRQEEIDALSEVNDSINDTNSKILDSMQEQIDAYRQERDNAKTEEEIANKQRRLAYLMQDTSGANALEILQLQKEIDEAQEDYTDTLIDQKISELQKQNDQAAEQRQHQIDLMQAQLDQEIDSGIIWQEVESLLANGINETGLVPGSRLEELLQDAADFSAMGDIEQMDWLNTLNSNVAAIASNLGITGQAGTFQSIYGVGTSFSFENANGQTVTGTVVRDGEGNISVQGSDGQTYGYDDFTMNAAGDVIYTAPKPPENPAPEESTGPVWDWSEDKKPSKATRNLYQGKYGEDVKNLQHALNRLGYNAGEEDKDFGPKTKVAVMAFQKDHKLPQDGNVGRDTREAFKRIQFKTGGLADFTGPAWLDGTKSKPEYILNADQTKAFFTLVDVLSGLTSNSTKPTEKTGDNTYDIDINVESIGSDYDVEQLADTIKRLINEDARYRNNNTINLMR